MTGKSGLAAIDLVVTRENRCVIDNLTLTVPAGTVYALLGGNGAGKTTAINTFLGFVPPSAGTLHIDGCEIAPNLPTSQRRLAYLPENVALYPELSGLQNLRYFCTLAGIKLDRDSATQQLLQAGLPADAIERRTAAYSKGMRQKVGLAIAYARGACAMLLDEPTSGLDPAAANDFANRIRTAAANGLAVLMATHDLFNAVQVADRIGILQAGRLVEEFDAHTVGHDELEQKYLLHARASTWAA